MISGLLTVALLAAPPVWASVPLVELRQEHVVMVGLPQVLAERAVREQLGTGLTATLSIEMELRISGAAAVRGRAQVGVRFDLWEEKYVLTVVDLDGERRLEAAGEAALKDVWAKTTLRLAQLEETPRGGYRARVRLVVLPFSQAEEEDTRTWFLRSARRTGPPSTTVPIREGQRPQQVGAVGQVLDAMLATSIGRRPMTTYTWEVDVAGAAP